MRLGCFVVAIAFAGCVEDEPVIQIQPPPHFNFAVSIFLPDSITAVGVDGTRLPVAAPGHVSWGRMWPTYDDALASTPIEFAFFEGDALVHTGHARPSVCAKALTDCPRNLITYEGIVIYDLMSGDPDGNYLDFDVGTATDLYCEGCGRGYGSAY